MLPLTTLRLLQLLATVAAIHFTAAAPNSSASPTMRSLVVTLKLHLLWVPVSAFLENYPALFLSGKPLPHSSRRIIAWAVVIGDEMALFTYFPHLFVSVCIHSVRGPSCSECANACAGVGAAVVVASGAVFGSILYNVRDWYGAVAETRLVVSDFDRLVFNSMFMVLCLCASMPLIWPLFVVISFKLS